MAVWPRHGRRLGGQRVRIRPREPRHTQRPGVAHDPRAIWHRPAAASMAALGGQRSRRRCTQRVADPLLYELIADAAAHLPSLANSRRAFASTPRQIGTSFRNSVGESVKIWGLSWKERSEGRFAEERYATLPHLPLAKDRRTNPNRLYNSLPIRAQRDQRFHLR